MNDSQPDLRYRLVALDIDGTVLNSRQEVTAEMNGVLRLLAERGVRAVLCTGRRWRSTMEVLEQLDHIQPTAVCCGGALVKEAGSERTLHCRSMLPATARLAADLYRQAGLAPLFLYDRRLDERELMLSEADRGVLESLPYVRMNPGCFAWFEGRYPPAGEPPLMLYTVDAGVKVRSAEGSLVEGLGELGIVKVMAQLRYGEDQVAVEVHHPEATKWHALQWLLDRWHIRPGQVVAIGDDINDLPMLEAAGLSFAMGNAVPAVKEVADELTATNDQHGAAEAIRRAFDL